MLKVAIIGATGYTGLELTRLILKHPKLQLTYLTSERYAGKKATEAFPHLLGFLELPYQKLSIEGASKESDFIFTALPHHVSMEVVSAFLELGKKVIDLSADFRLKDPQTYYLWYGKSHISPHLLERAVYGLSEINRQAIKGTSLVANPGCYPTGIILALAPLLKEGIISTEAIVIDSKSGVSGAGRSPSLESHYPEVAEGFKAYRIGQHRHMPEIEQELGLIAKKNVTISFATHLVPINRGILNTIYTQPIEEIDTYSLLKLYQNFYENEPFIRIYPPNIYPNTVNVRGSNFCDIGISYHDKWKRILIVSAIDNLVKGGAGQAVQNMNIMAGFEENLGLDYIPLFP